MRQDCRYCVNGNHCTLLTKPYNCRTGPFFKTPAQFNAEADRAVLICRKKGQCDRCRYVMAPCRLSSEFK